MLFFLDKKEPKNQERLMLATHKAHPARQSFRPPHQAIALGFFLYFENNNVNCFELPQALACG